MCPRPGNSTTSQLRNWQSLAKERHLRSFLDKHGFIDESHPRDLGSDGARIKMECMYPIHVAAQLGDTYIMRILLETGVDPQTGAYGGHTPMDLAKEARRTMKSWVVNEPETGCSR